MRGHDEDEDERSVGEVAETLYSKVTHYHAQIGPAVKKEALNELEWKLLSEAKDLFHRAMYEEALNTFTHCLAVTEKTRSSKDLAVRGAILHNIASCLHHLGQYTAAQKYYEQAIDAFTRCHTPTYEKLLYGNTNQRRVDFVKERLIDISWGRKPDIDKYLDENARKQPVPQVPAGARTGTATNLSREWGAEESAGPTEIERPLPAWAGGGGSRRGFAPVGIPDDDERGGYGPREAEDEDDAAQEQARKEWLQYYLQVENWDKAAELVVTPAEREDLDYLKGYQKRAAESSRGQRAMEGLGSNRRERDMYELNDAALSASSRKAHDAPPAQPNKSTARAARDDDDDDDML